MKLKNKWPKYYKKDVITHYCPGCGHGIVHRIVAELLEEMKLGKRTIGVNPAGCAVLAYKYFDFDMIESAHGRGTALATGIKRARPDLFVLSYQGDGDLSAIGTAETIHSASRGELFTLIFINNAVYGMTGGQMAPTTLPGMRATTAPFGRDVDDTGYPMRVCELLSTLEMPNYIERVSLLTPKDILKAKKAVKKALNYNVEKKGFSFVEMLSNCPTNWGLDTMASIEWAKENMLPIFPLGLFKDRAAEEKVKEE